MFAEYKAFSKRKIYLDTGISNGILDKNGGLSEDSILKFLSTYREIDPTWFLTGEKKMLRESELIEEIKNIADPGVNYNNCQHCEEKERIIENQRERILELKDTIDILKTSNEIQTKRHFA